MLREFEDEEENIIFNDENKIMSMSQEEFKEYLDSLDIKFTSEYGLNTTIQNPYLYDVFTIICSNGNEQLYEWLKEFRDHNNFKSNRAFKKCLVNSHIELFKKIVLETMMGVDDVNHDLVLNTLSDCIEIGNHFLY